MFFLQFSAQHSCSLLQTRCKNDSVCIPSYMVCDSVADCPDRSDEDHCTKKRSCNETDFKCLDGLTCVPLTSRCDQKRDCADGSDEDKCSKIFLLKDFLWMEISSGIRQYKLSLSYLKEHLK